jgi:hypothetical protein
MSNVTRLVLAAALVGSNALTATAATSPRAADNQVANYNVIPGYDSQGQTVAIQNPDRRAR